jgi:hypothetical protein
MGHDDQVKGFSNYASINKKYNIHIKLYRLLVSNDAIGLP